MNLPPATLPPEYLPLKRKLMSADKAGFASLRTHDVRLRLLEIMIFLLVWVGGATLTLFAATVQPLLIRLLLQGIGIFASGVALLVFFMEVHEGMHSILFRNKVFNDLISCLFCLPLFLSLTGSTVLHLRHHRYLGRQGDPDEYKLYAKTKPGLWALYYSRLFIAPLIYIFLIPILGYRHGTRAQRLRIVAEWALMLCIYIFLFTQVSFSALALTWLIPSAVTGFLIGLWGLVQHTLTDAGDPLLASRSVHASRLVSFCFLNQNYHLEHHLFPEIPSYHLKRVYEAIRDQLPYALSVDSYTGFLIEFIRLSFKLEDRPIGYTEIIGW